MAKSGQKAIFLQGVILHSNKALELLEALQPLLDVTCNEADSKFDVAAGQADTRLRTLRRAAQRAFDELPDAQ